MNDDQKKAAEKRTAEELKLQSDQREKMLADSKSHDGGAKQAPSLFDEEPAERGMFKKSSSKSNKEK
jgi:hypothetical protein